MSDDAPDSQDTPSTPKKAGEGELFVRDTGGEGRGVVLIHGWPLSSESWSEQYGPLQEAGYRVVAYDRRGFGKSGPGDGYDYDRLTDDLANVIEETGVDDVTLVGFSMGGGEVARYVAKYGEDKLHSVVFAAAVPPYLPKTDDNPDGPLDDETAQQFQDGITSDRDAFFDQFATWFYSAGDDLKVDEETRRQAVALARLSDEQAAEGCMQAFASTDFRQDLTKITVPTLVIHGDSDGIVPFEGSGKRTHETVEGSELVLVEDAPHGLNVSHATEFNRALIDFLGR